LYSEEIHDLYPSPNIIRQIRSRRMKGAGHVACMGEKRKVCEVSVGKPEGKRPLGRWENVSRMTLREIGWGCGLDSTGSV
jgi:hypothetical protein